MTRTTGEIMEWRDRVRIQRLESYCTGYLDATALEPAANRTTADYDEGYEHGLRHLAKANLTP